MELTLKHTVCFSSLFACPSQGAIIKPHSIAGTPGMVIYGGYTNIFPFWDWDLVQFFGQIYTAFLHHILLRFDLSFINRWSIFMIDITFNFDKIVAVILCLTCDHWILIFTSLWADGRQFQGVLMYALCAPCAHITFSLLSSHHLP